MEEDTIAQDDLLIDFLEEWEEGSEELDLGSAHDSQEHIAARGVEYPLGDFVMQSPICNSFEQGLQLSNPIEIPGRRWGVLSS